ncbi:hypothetical protein EV363DRAFT_1405139 [Boletus edulis]|nr:hypothetical protein EV363DRAFT_1405139 [Boletus edulis]
MTAFVRTVLYYNDGKLDESLADGVGILGQVSAYYGCVEAQGRGSLHCHMLVWLDGSLNCDEIKEKIINKGDIDFRDRLLTSIPEDPLPDVDIPSSIHHPCSVRGPSLDGDTADIVLLKRKKDLHCLATACQVHKHTATCYKYWKGPPHPRECRFGKTVVDETGDVVLQYLDGKVNRYNETMLECVRCNMDIQFVGSGRSAKAILYYVTDYITKTQLKAHVAYAALDLAVSKLGEYDPTVDELKLRAKRLLQKCAYSMISHQELSAQQVCSYLLDHGDHYTSHVYRCLYWTAFEAAINKELPSPECYHQPIVSQADDDDDISSDSDENSDNEIGHEHSAVTSDDVVISANGEGGITPRSNQVEDYRLRPVELNYVCLAEIVKSLWHDMQG